MSQLDLPHDADAEKGVLGSMLMSPDAVAKAVEQLSISHFHIPAHALIFEFIIELWHAATPIDQITLSSAMRKNGSLTAVGGAAFLAHLFIFVPSPSNVGQYIEIVREQYELRETFSVLTQGALRCREKQANAREIIPDCAASLGRITAGQCERRSTKELVSDVMDSLSEYESVYGISTGYPKLDAVIGGLAPGAKIVIAGQISGGKSAFAQNVAKSLAIDRNIPTAIFTFEMSDEQTMRRLMQIHSRVSVKSIVNRTADAFENAEFLRAVEAISTAPIWVISDRLDIAGIRSRCLQLRPRVAIIDYFQIVPEKKQKGENTTEKLDRMSAETKQMAMGLGFPLSVIELSQLTEKADGQMMTRGSKGILADSDILAVLEGEDDPEKESVTKTLSVPKNRDDGRSSIEFSFHKPTTTFREKKATY
jgi:replicative DNA helicase